MGNEMGNNNTSEFREEEQAKAEGPEKSLLEGGGNEVKVDEVADFRQKEARLGSDGEDRVNGDHHVTTKEEEKNKAYNTAEFQVVSEKLPDRTKVDNEVQAKSKEDKTNEFNSEENRSDGNEHEHEKQASNQKEDEEEKGSNLNTTILAIDEPKLEKTLDFKSAQNEFLDIKAEPLVEDSNKSPEECKDALGLSLNSTYHSADCAMAADSEETTNMDQVNGIDKENGAREKGLNFYVITQASEDPNSKKSSDIDADQFLETNQEADKEDDKKRGKGSNFDTITQASEDPKSEITSDFDVDRDTNKEDDRERVKGSNSNTITQASKDPKSEKISDFDADQAIDNENDAARGKGSNDDTITQVSKDPKSEKTSNLDADEVIVADQDTNKEDGGEKGKGFNFDTITRASEDPKSEKTSNFDVEQVIDTNQDVDREDVGEKGKGSNFDMITQSSKDPKFKKTSNFNADQVIDIDRDTDAEHDAERGKGSNFKTLHVLGDLKSEKNSDLKSIHHELPETKAETLTGSSDDGSSQESKYCLGSSLKHTEGNGDVMYTEKLTNMDCIGAESQTDIEKKKGDLIEARSYHEYTTLATKIVDTKHEETAIDLISHNSSCSTPEESLVIESPNLSMHGFEDRCTVLKEESRLREEHLGNETIVLDNIPTQSRISNGVQEEFNTIGSYSENNAEETEASPESVVKNQNEAPGEECEDSDGEYLEISEQCMAILTSSIEERKHKNEEMGETGEISTNIGHEAKRREPEESPFEPPLGFQSQIHEKETSITFQTGESRDEPISTPRQEAETATEQSKKKPSDSPHYIQTASATFTETEPSTNPIDEQSVTTLPFSTFRGEDQESPGRTSNESNSDNSISHIEMRKSPSFNIDIQSEGRAGEAEKIPLLYQIKTIEDLPNLQEISFPNPMEERVGKLGRSDSEKSRPSFPGFVKEKEESEMEFKAIDQHNLAAAKKAVKDLPPSSPIRKGKRRSKSLIFGTCICCATAIN